jgi:hypothetical protein
LNMISFSLKRYSWPWTESILTGISHLTSSDKANQILASEFSSKDAGRQVACFPCHQPDAWMWSNITNIAVSSAIAWAELSTHFQAINQDIIWEHSLHLPASLGHWNQTQTLVLRDCISKIH